MSGLHAILKPGQSLKIREGVTITNDGDANAKITISTTRGVNEDKSHGQES